jgi:benzoate membrane transport protein
MRFFKDLSPSAFTAGFVAVLVGFTSSVAIVFQAALAFEATPAQITSWMWALGLGMGLCTLVPSLWLRKPVMVAWSTPGAAVLATAGVAGGFSMNEAVGAFMVCAVLITLCGVTGWFERVMNHLPLAIASGLLAGVLARFGLQAFTAAQTNLPLVLVMLGTYLLGKRLLPRYAVPLTLLVAVTQVALTTGLAGARVDFEFAQPVFIAPSFTLQAAITGALTAFPKELIAAIAGLALLGTMGSAMATAVRDELHREAALITFLVTLSGVVIAGVGSAFWGVVAGASALFVQQYGKSRFSPPSA